MPRPSLLYTHPPEASELTNFLCKRLRRAFKWLLQTSGSSGYSRGGRSRL